jgi:hypothetical protein
MRAREFITDGIGGQFIHGLTGGQTSSLGGLAKMGAAKAASGLGLNTTAGNINATIKPSEYGTGADVDVNKLPPEIRNMSAKELADALGFRVGTVDFFGNQRVKVTAINADGIEGTDVQSHMPVSYPKEALMMLLAKQQQAQQS